MEIADMNLYLMQSFMEEFVDVYGRQIDELLYCVSTIKRLDDGIMKEHWSGEGRDAFTAKINEWIYSFRKVKMMMENTKNAVCILDEDTDILIKLVASMKIIENKIKYVDTYRKTMS